MIDLHKVEIIESYRMSNRYGQDSQEHWTLRRIKVEGGWLYESRTLCLKPSGGDYPFIVHAEGLASVFVPELERGEVSNG